VKLLLDTHIWLWIHQEPKKLTSEIQEVIASRETQRWLSPVSIWELSMLIEKKRVTLRDHLHSWISKSAEELDLQEAAFSWKVAEELPFTQLSHRDPADRLLVATARAYGLTLVTADKRLMHVPDLQVLANR
jgi:PIN domain nuclease of toxin-antitoxin system